MLIKMTMVISGTRANKICGQNFANLHFALSSKTKLLFTKSYNGNCTHIYTCTHYTHCKHTNCIQIVNRMNTQRNDTAVFAKKMQMKNYG